MERDVVITIYSVTGPRCSKGGFCENSNNCTEHNSSAHGAKVQYLSITCPSYKPIAGKVPVEELYQTIDVVVKSYDSGTYNCNFQDHCKNRDGCPHATHYESMSKGEITTVRCARYLPIKPGS
jgi:hypothetical protein